MSGKMYRQGDVLIVRVDELPENAVQAQPALRGVVLAEGEATGHAHTMSAETVTKYQALERDWIVVKEPTPLTHEEHNVINIAPGTYWVLRQRVYTPERNRYVLD